MLPSIIMDFMVINMLYKKKDTYLQISDHLLLSRTSQLNSSYPCNGQPAINYPLVYSNSVLQGYDKGDPLRKDLPYHHRYLVNSHYFHLNLI